MQIATDRDSLEQARIEYCRNLARLAEVDCSYVTYPEDSSCDLGRSFASLPDACRWLLENQGTLAAVFAWTFGSLRSLDAVLYSLPTSGFTPTERFIRQTLDNTITKRIAADLYKEHLKRINLRPEPQ